MGRLTIYNIAGEAWIPTNTFLDGVRKVKYRSGQHVEAGSLRTLALMHDKRLKTFPVSQLESK
jgi:hypothetical protein